MKFVVSTRTYLHPSEAFDPWPCRCGAVLDLDTPEFESDLSSYKCEAVCATCHTPYLIIGLDSSFGPVDLLDVQRGIAKSMASQKS